MKSKTTNRGFERIDFKDFSNEPCSIQESSLATDYAIWLGCDHETMDPQGRPCGSRMHLSQALAAELIPLLQRFVDTGYLSEGPSK